MSSRHQDGLQKTLGELTFPFHKCPCLIAVKFWLASKYSGGKEKACQWSIYLPLGGIWGAFIKYLFFGPKASRSSFFFSSLVPTATFCGDGSGWTDPSHLRKGRKPKEDIFWERATVPALLPPGCHSPGWRESCWGQCFQEHGGVGGGKGQGAEPWVCPFPVLVLSAGGSGWAAQPCCRDGIHRAAHRGTG